MDFKDVTCDDMDWIQLAQDRDQWQAVKNTAIYIRVQ
jgi:hypothetical protein